MVSAGSEMFVNPRLDRFQVSPGDHRINQPIAASVGEIGFSKSQSQKVIGVIRQRKVERKELSRRRACLSRIRFQNDSLLRTQERSCTQQLSGLGCVLWSGVVWMCAVGTLRGESQHLRPQRG